MYRYMVRCKDISSPFVIMKKTPWAERDSIKISPAPHPPESVQNHSEWSVMASILFSGTINSGWMLRTNPKVFLEHLTVQRLPK